MGIRNMDNYRYNEFKKWIDIMNLKGLNGDF